MNFQTSKRIMCCLLAVLILCCAVVRPMEVSATAVLPAAAAISGISADWAVAGILAALGYGAANSQLPYLEFVQDIAETIPAELILIGGYNTFGAVPVVKHEDITYLARPLVDYVVDALYTRAVFESPVSEKRYEMVGDPGAALDSALDWYYNETTYYPGHLDKEYCVVLPFTSAGSDKWTILFSDEPIEVSEPDSNGNYKVTVHGECEQLSTTSSGSWQYTGYNPNSYPYTTTRTYTGTWTDNYIPTGGSYVISSLFSKAIKIIGNTAPDLTDDEEYQAYLARQQFFIVDPDGNGDNDGNNEEPKKQAYLPVKLLETLFGNGFQTQEEAQSGEIPENQPNYVELPNATVNPQPSGGVEPSPQPSPLPEGSAAVSPDVGPNDKGSDLFNWLELIYKALVNIMLNIIVQIEQLQYLPAKIANAFEYLFGNIRIWIYEQIAAIEAAMQWIGDKIDAIIQELILLPAKIEIFFDNLGARIETAFQWIWEHLASAFETLGSIITTAFEWIWQHLATAFQNVIDTLNTFWQNLKNWMQIMADYLLSGIRAIFVPSEDYLTGKVNALRSEFAFADSIVTTAQALNMGLIGITTEPPIIYIDLGAARWAYNIGGKVPFIDMTWYAEYKPTVDALISAFLWICFIWRALIHLPGIISGASGIFTLSYMPPTHTAPIGSLKTDAATGMSYVEMLDLYHQDMTDNPGWGAAFGRNPSFETLKELYSSYDDDSLW